MFLINNQPANDVLRPIVADMHTATPNEIEQTVRSVYTEQWFDTKTPSLRGNDNRLNHRIRTLRAALEASK